MTGPAGSSPRADERARAARRAADGAGHDEHRRQARGDLPRGDGGGHEQRDHEDRADRAQPDDDGDDEQPGHRELQGPHGQAGRPREGRVEERRLQGAEADRDGGQGGEREHRHDLHVALEQPGGLPEEVGVQARLVGVVGPGDRGEQDDAEREGAREHDARRRVGLQARRALQAEHREGAEAPRDRGADEQRRRVLRPGEQERERHAGQRRVGERVADERTLAQHREGPQHAGRAPEEHRAAEHDRVGVGQRQEVDQRAHASSSPTPP